MSIWGSWPFLWERAVLTTLQPTKWIHWRMRRKAGCTLTRPRDKWQFGGGRDYVSGRTGWGFETQTAKEHAQLRPLINNARCIGLSLLIGVSWRKWLFAGLTGWESKPRLVSSHSLRDCVYLYLCQEFQKKELGCRTVGSSLHPVPQHFRVYQLHLSHWIYTGDM